MKRLYGQHSSHSRLIFESIFKYIWQILQFRLPWEEGAEVGWPVCWSWTETPHDMGSEPEKGSCKTSFVQRRQFEKIKFWTVIKEGGEAFLFRGLLIQNLPSSRPITGDKIKLVKIMYGFMAVMGSTVGYYICSCRAVMGSTVGYYTCSCRAAMGSTVSWSGSLFIYFDS